MNKKIFKRLTGTAQIVKLQTYQPFGRTLGSKPDLVKLTQVDINSLLKQFCTERLGASYNEELRQLIICLAGIKTSK